MGPGVLWNKFTGIITFAYKPIMLVLLWRRVAFPMGAYGAPTLKMTVTLSMHTYGMCSKSGDLTYFWWTPYLDLRLVSTAYTNLNSKNVPTPKLLRVWSTLDTIHSLWRPLDVKKLKEILARRLVVIRSNGDTWSLYRIVMSIHHRSQCSIQLKWHPMNLCSFEHMSSLQNK